TARFRIDGLAGLELHNHCLQGRAYDLVIDTTVALTFLSYHGFRQIDPLTWPAAISPIRLIIRGRRRLRSSDWRTTRSAETSIRRKLRITLRALHNWLCSFKLADINELPYSEAPNGPESST